MIYDFFFLLSFFRSENDCRRCHRVCEEPSRCHHSHRLLSLRFRFARSSNLHGGLDAKMHPTFSRRSGSTTARAQRLRVRLSSGLARVRPQLEQLVLAGGQARSRPLRELQRGRNVPGQLHVHARLRPKPELRLHEFRHFRLGLPIGFSSHDPRLLGGIVPGFGLIPFILH